MEFHTNFKSGKEITTKVCSCGKPRINGRRKCLQCISALEREKKKIRMERKKLLVATRKQKKREKKENHIPTLIKKADKAFSDFIRARDKYICQTCGKRLDKSNAHCSHFVGRMNMNTRFEEKNCICQCAEENIFHEGNKPLFAEYLIGKYGIEIIKELNEKARTIKQWQAQELKDLIKYYQDILPVDKI